MGAPDGGPADTSGDDGDAPNGTGDAPSDAGDATACNSLQSDASVACLAMCNTAPVVSVVYSTQAPPVPMGGTIAQGLYYVTAVTDYFPQDAGVEAGTSTATLQRTAMVGPATPVGIDQTVDSTDGGPNQTAVYEYLPSGTYLLVTETCPSVQQPQLQFSASGAEVRVYSMNSTAVSPYVKEEVYTLQMASDAAGPSFDAGAPDACTQTLSDAQVACNSLCNTAPSISVLSYSGTAPAPTGGTILDGTYFLSSKTQFTGGDSGADGGAGYSEQETVVITTSGGVTELQDIQSSNGGPAQTLAFSLVAQGPSLYLTALCPASPQKMQGTLGFSASGGQLTIFVQSGSSGNAVDVSVFTKQ
jgi:hypothetical protein